MAMTTKFSDTGSTMQVLRFDSERLHDTLPPAVYAVGLDPMTGFFLTKRSERMSAPTRIYGVTQKRVDHILKAYQAAPGAFGVLMSGDKGSGKTMSSSLVANHAIDVLKLPVVIVDRELPGSALSSFISTLGECVLFFDEFAKTFNDGNNQQELLGLFDGATAGRRLALLTENSLSNVSRYMMNRPGRMFYHFRHGRVEPEVIQEYCMDHGINEETTAEIIKRREQSTEFSFDVLQAIVREYKLFGGEIAELCESLNIEQPRVYQAMAEAEVISIQDATNGIKRKLHPRSARGPIPMPVRGQGCHLTVLGVPRDGQDPESVSSDYINLTFDDLVDVDDKGVHSYAATDDMENRVLVKLRQKPEESGNWFTALI